MRALTCLAATLLASVVLATQSSRIVLPADTNWLFSLGDLQEAEAPTFQDASWREVGVPHDWSIEGPYDEKNPTGGAGGFLPAGIGWYRKNFALPTDYTDRRIFIEFDGVMANSDVWINRFHLGHRPYGYVSFRYELTGHLSFGGSQTNVLAVRVDNSQQPASRWYAGAGIYRHVRLVVTDPIHIEHWGTFITTPTVLASQAVIHVQTTVVNQSEKSRDAAVQWTILAPDPARTRSSASSTSERAKGMRGPGATESRRETILPGKSFFFQHDIPIKNPQLWDL